MLIIPHEQSMTELFIEEEVAFEVNIISLSKLLLEYDKNTCQEKKEIKEDTSVTESSEILPYLVMDFFSL